MSTIYKFIFFLSFVTTNALFDMDSNKTILYRDYSVMRPLFRQIYNNIKRFDDECRSSEKQCESPQNKFTKEISKSSSSEYRVNLSFIVDDDDHSMKITIGGNCFLYIKSSKGRMTVYGDMNKEMIKKTFFASSELLKKYNNI